MVNQVTPNGTLNYSQSGTYANGDPQYTATTALSPQAQAINDASQQAQAGVYGVANQSIGQVGNTLANPFSTAGLPAAPTGDNQYDQQATDALYGQMQSRLKPQQDLQNEQFDVQMANQGIPVGSEAYQRAMTNKQQGQNDATQTALNQAIAGGSAAASNKFNMQSTANQNAFNQSAYQYNLPINQAATLMGTGGAVPGLGTIGTPQTNVAGTDVIGATNGAMAANQNAYNSKMQQQAGLMGSLGSLGGSAMMALALSDRRLKTAIRKVGKLRSGLNLYTFRYRWSREPQLGVMAQEVQKVFPQAVVEVDGYLAVNYGKVW